MTQQLMESTETRWQQIRCIDCDVHPQFPGHWADSLKPYMPAGWRTRFGGNGTPFSAYELPGVPYYGVPGGLYRMELLRGGRVPCSDPAQAAADLLERNEIDRALMMPQIAGAIGLFPDPNVATTIAGAMNDYFLEKWTRVDNRWRSMITIAPQDIGWSLREVERLQGELGVAGIHIPLNNVLMGTNHFYPLYEACEHYRLCVTVHLGVAGIYYTGMPAPGGAPVNWIDFRGTATYAHAAQVSSLVCNGVFEMFPKLQVLFAEVGYGWLPDLMWRLDNSWKAARKATPYLRRPPSEYIVDHVKLSTQPWVEPPRESQVEQMLDMMRAERTLVFSSDFPHWDGDEPMYVAGKLPERMRRRVLVDNAAEAIGDRIL
jgi:predicted TIM-barrel fold metal-dependent hydrolase